MWLKNLIEEELRLRSLLKKIEADRELAGSKVEVVGYFPDGWICATIPSGIFVDKKV